VAISNPGTSKPIIEGAGRTVAYVECVASSRIQAIDTTVIGVTPPVALARGAIFMGREKVGKAHALFSFFGLRGRFGTFLLPRFGGEPAPAKAGVARQRR
jgi:hypothetical protein